jgi:hypothetical protein
MLCSPLAVACRAGRQSAGYRDMFEFLVWHLAMKTIPARDG